MSTLFRFRFVVLALLVLSLSGCSSSTAPEPVSSLTISTPTPAPGSVIQADPIGIQFFIPRLSGRISVPITVTSGREVPYAQLNVYLFDGGGTLGYCGQNFPDAPTWGPFNKGQTVSVQISGFQVFRVPCQVTSIRAWLHTRNNGAATPPISSETVAEGSLTVSYTIR